METKLKFWILIFGLILTTSCAEKSFEKAPSLNSMNLHGKYLGQTEPGLQPEIFAPNLVSTGMAEINAVFNHAFTEFYYTIRMPDGHLVIMVMELSNSKWSEPKVASFSGDYSDADPYFSPDGNWLYFISKRPIDSTSFVNNDWDIWRTKRDGSKWLEPERLSSEINSELDETYPSLTLDGKLYFSSERKGKNKKDIYYAEPSNGEFRSPVRLSDTINSHWEGDIYISPDEDYMIFSSYGRESGSGLYIAFNHNGHWSMPQRMSKDINMTGREFCPIVSPDGSFFFFTSNNTAESQNPPKNLTFEKIREEYSSAFQNPQMGKTDVYWVSIDIVNEYRNSSH